MVVLSITLINVKWALNELIATEKIFLFQGVFNVLLNHQNLGMHIYQPAFSIEERTNSLNLVIVVIWPILRAASYPMLCEKPPVGNPG